MFVTLKRRRVIKDVHYTYSVRITLWMELCMSFCPFVCEHILFAYCLSSKKICTELYVVPIYVSIFIKFCIYGLDVFQSSWNFEINVSLDVEWNSPNLILTISDLDIYSISDSRHIRPPDRYLPHKLYDREIKNIITSFESHQWLNL